MVIKNIQWYGMLANVNKSILNISLSHGFTIRYFTEKEAVYHFQELGDIKDHRGFYDKYLMDIPIFNASEKRVYYLYNEEEIEVEVTESGYLTKSFSTSRAQSSVNARVCVNSYVYLFNLRALTKP